MLLTSNERSLRFNCPMTLMNLSEKILDVNDIVSIVFLMCDNPVTALSILTQNLNTSPTTTKSLSDLLKILSNYEHRDFEKKLIESLIFIRNFKCLKVLGYNMTEIDNIRGMFSENLKSSSISSFRKALFRVCEGLNREETTYLVHLIDNCFKQRKNYAQYLQYKYLEIKFLSLMCQECLTDESTKGIILSKIIKILESMKKFNLVDELKNFINYEESRIGAVGTDNNFDHDLDYLSKNGVKFYSQDLNDRYVMDVRNIGLCVILNQRDFSRSYYSGRKLDFRHGTDSDRDILQITFSVLGYKVIVLENKGSIEFEEAMKRIVESHILPEHSSFALCILSHGSEGAIYCVDGMEVPIKKIKHWILGEECPQLLRKPKIMIIQACQGCKKQRVTEEWENASSLENEGPVKYSPVRTSAFMRDLIAFNATVPGFATFRFVYSGSIFIQTLCSQLLKYPLADIHEVFLKVNQILSEKNTSSIVITSNVDHTLTKKIFYPIKKENKIEGAVMLYEKFLINELINFCIFRVAAWKIYKKVKADKINEDKNLTNTAE